MEENAFVPLEEITTSTDSTINVAPTPKTENYDQVISPINNTFSSAITQEVDNSIINPVEENSSVTNVTTDEQKPGDLINNLPEWDLTPPLVLERGGENDIL